MDPLEWQRLADQYAESMNNDVSLLERDFWPHPPGGSFRAFWPRVRELNERVRTAPAIKLDDKLALQRRLNDLSQRARQDQKGARRENASRKQALLEAVDLARESLAQADAVEQVQEIREDLAALRQRISELDASFRREDRQQVWNAWQAANQTAWERVNELWRANEVYLASLLDQAQQSLEAAEVRVAKDTIKTFHEGVRARECTHRSLRGLRARAHALWAEADEIAKRKHDAYLANMSKRVSHWKAARERHARIRSDLARQIEELERRAAGAATDVGAALVRGQVAERRKALADVEAADRSLAKQIEEVESALSHA